MVNHQSVAISNTGSSHRELISSSLGGQISQSIKCVGRECIHTTALSENTQPESSHKYRQYSNSLKQYRNFLAVNDAQQLDTVYEKFIDDRKITETERTSIIKSRIGQGIFREKLIEKYKKEFDRRMKKYGIDSEMSFEQTLNRLKTRELIVGKSDYLAVDALYNLVKDLYVVPLGTVSIFKRAFTFLLMCFKALLESPCLRFS